MSAAVVFKVQVLDTRVEYFQSVSGTFTRSLSHGREEAPENQTFSFAEYLLTSADLPVNPTIATSLQDLRAFFESEFETISEVAHVKIAERNRHGNRIVHVWTILHKDDRATRFRVYEVEGRLTDLFPELLFEFHTHRFQPDAPDGDSTVYEQYD